MTKRIIDLGIPKKNAIELAVTTQSYENSGAGALVYDASQNKFLVGLRSHSSSKPNTWSVFGGHIEDGENPRLTAFRELQEETGFKGFPKQSFLLSMSKDLNTDFTFYTYLFVITAPFNVKLNKEHTKYKWVSLDEMPTPMHPNFAKLMRDKKVIVKIERTIERYHK